MFAVHTQRPCVTLTHVEDMYQIQDVGVKCQPYLRGASKYVKMLHYVTSTVRISRLNKFIFFYYLTNKISRRNLGTLECFHIYCKDTNYIVKYIF